MHVTLHLTGRCNLRCRYCYDSDHAGGDMSASTVRAAIDLAVRSSRGNGGPQSIGVIFFGGEPLLRRDLIVAAVRHCRAIERATGQLFHFKVTTNGSLLDEEFLTDRDTRDVFVAFSHDGVQAAHDAHRVDATGRGTYQRLDRKIDLLLRHRPYSPVMMTVTPTTVGHYADSVAALHDRGFRYLICSLDYGSAWRRGQLAELRRQYTRLGRWYYDLMIAEEKFYFSPFEVKIASHIHPESCLKERCELGQRQISVAPNGKLYPCVQFVGDGSDDTYCIGHVSGGVEHAARARLYTMAAREKASCVDCAIRERCNHFCGCLSKQATGRIDVVSPVLCAHERTVLPIADRVAERLFRKRSPLFIQKHYNELYPLISLVEDRSTPVSGAKE